MRCFVWRVDYFGTVGIFCDFNPGLFGHALRTQDGATTYVRTAVLLLS